MIDRSEQAARAALLELAKQAQALAPAFDAAIRASDKVRTDGLIAELIPILQQMAALRVELGEGGQLFNFSASFPRSTV